MIQVIIIFIIVAVHRSKMVALVRYTFLLASIIAIECASHGRAIPAGSCGQTSVEPRVQNSTRPNGNRIVGGVDAKPHSFPWIVSMQWRGKHMCGGSLIRVNNNQEQSDIVITAAHCLIAGFQPIDLQAFVGSHILFKQEPDEQRIRIQKYVVHENYSKRHMANDIAILKLETPVRFGPNIQPICLPNSNEQVADATQGTVAGWGFLKEGSGQHTNILMQVSVPTINPKACQANYQGDYIIDPKAMICAGYGSGGRDACQGDSGGPFMFKSNRGYVMQGVVSFGDGCAQANKPGVYSRVSNYIDWINKHVQAVSSLNG